MADMVFASAFKVCSTFSSSRFGCDLKDAYEKGYLNPRSTSAYLESPELTPVLNALIVRSSLPLKTVETVFAPDSTGFSTSRFIRWYDEKYGAERSGRDWVTATDVDRLAVVQSWFADGKLRDYLILARPRKNGRPKKGTTPQREGEWWCKSWKSLANVVPGNIDLHNPQAVVKLESALVKIPVDALLVAMATKAKR